MTTVTISTETWQGRLGMGLAPRELEATLHAASDLTAKEIAKLMGIAPGTVSKRLDDARFKLGAKTIRGLVLAGWRDHGLGQKRSSQHPGAAARR